jgi:hypothetical protein
MSPDQVIARNETIRIKLAAAVAAKLRWWAALRELEEVTTRTYAFTDDQNEAIIEQIDCLAGGIDDPDSALACIDDAAVEDTLTLIYGKPK